MLVAGRVNPPFLSKQKSVKHREKLMASQPTPRTKNEGLMSEAFFRKPSVNIKPFIIKPLQYF